MTAAAAASQLHKIVASCTSTDSQVVWTQALRQQISLQTVLNTSILLPDSTADCILQNEALPAAVFSLLSRLVLAGCSLTQQQAWLASLLKVLGDVFQRAVSQSSRRSTSASPLRFLLAVSAARPCGVLTLMMPAAPAHMCSFVLDSAAVISLDLLVCSMNYPEVQVVLSADPHMPHMLASACRAILRVFSTPAYSSPTSAISSLVSLLRMNAEGIWVGSHRLVAQVLLQAVVTLRWHTRGERIGINAACAFARYCANDSDGWLTCALPRLSFKDCLNVVPAAGSADFGPQIADAGLGVSVAHVAACDLLRVIFLHITQAAEQQSAFPVVAPYAVRVLEDALRNWPAAMRARDPEVVHGQAGAGASSRNTASNSISTAAEPEAAVASTSAPVRTAVSAASTGAAGAAAAAAVAPVSVPTLAPEPAAAARTTAVPCTTAANHTTAKLVQSCAAALSLLTACSGCLMMASTGPGEWS